MLIGARVSNRHDAAGMGLTVLVSVAWVTLLRIGHDLLRERNAPLLDRYLELGFGAFPPGC